MKFRKVLQLLIEFFETESIDYALVGAFALKAYGYTRATQDVDFIVRQKDQQKIVSHLGSIGFETIYCSTGYSNHVHPLSGFGRIGFVYIKGETADAIFRETSKLLVSEDTRLPVVSPEHLVALKVFAMKNDPDRALNEMGDIKFLVRLPGIDLARVRGYFEKYKQMERYYEIVGERQNS